MVGLEGDAITSDQLVDLGGATTAGAIAIIATEALIGVILKLLKLSLKLHMLSGMQ